MHDERPLTPRDFLAPIATLLPLADALLARHYDRLDRSRFPDGLFTSARRPLCADVITRAVGALKRLLQIRKTLAGLADRHDRADFRARRGQWWAPNLASPHRLTGPLAPLHAALAPIESDLRDVLEGWLALPDFAPPAESLTDAIDLLFYLTRVRKTLWLVMTGQLDLKAHQLRALAADLTALTGGADPTANPDLTAALAAPQLAALLAAAGDDPAALAFLAQILADDPHALLNPDLAALIRAGDPIPKGAGLLTAEERSARAANAASFRSSITEAPAFSPHRIPTADAAFAFAAEKIGQRHHPPTPDPTSKPKPAAEIIEIASLYGDSASPEAESGALASNQVLVFAYPPAPSELRRTTRGPPPFLLNSPRTPRLHPFPSCTTSPPPRTRPHPPAAPPPFPSP